MAIQSEGIKANGHPTGIAKPSLRKIQVTLTPTFPRAPFADQFSNIQPNSGPRTKTGNEVTAFDRSILDDVYSYGRGAFRTAAEVLHTPYPRPEDCVDGSQKHAPANYS